MLHILLLHKMKARIMTRFRPALLALALGASLSATAMDMHTMQRVVPMPNLMMLANQRADSLQLSVAQQDSLKSWASQHLPAQNALAQQITRLEEELKSQILGGADRDAVARTTQALEIPRAALIQIRRECAAQLQRTLTPAQWQQLLGLLPAASSKPEAMAPEKMGSMSHTANTR